ncbi:MAG: response regulator [bacterium]
MKKILVGDRNIALQKLIELRLSDRDLKVELTSDTDEIKEAMEKEPIDLMIIDIDLPNEGALPIYKKLRASSDHAYVPVMLLVKGLQENDSRLNDFEDIDMVLARPFEAKDFINAIGQLLDKCAQPIEALDGLLNAFSSTTQEAQKDEDSEIMATQDVQDTILTDLPESSLQEEEEDTQTNISASQEVQDDILSSLTGAASYEERDGDSGDKREEEVGPALVLDDEIAQSDIFAELTNTFAGEDENAHDEMIDEDAEEESDQEPALSDEEDNQEDEARFDSEDVFFEEEKKGLFTEGITDSDEEDEHESEDSEDNKQDEDDSDDEEENRNKAQAEETGSTFDSLSIEKWIKKIVIERVDKVIHESMEQLFKEQVQNLVDDLAEKLILEEIRRIKGEEVEE